MLIRRVVPAVMTTLSDDMASAASDDDVDRVRHLLDAGEDVDAANESGETAFSYACANNALRVARLLYEGGANIHTVDVGGGSPLDWAVCWSSPEFRAWLKSVGGSRHDSGYPEWPWPRENAGAREDPT
jgi:hypothetical protein